jgi:1,4-alpha-glucan branching enzyme
LYYTTDGSDPAGAFGQAENGRAIPMQPARTEWNTLDWGYIRHFRAQVPGQPEGTVVRYRLSAGEDAQLEIFADQGAYYAFLVADDPVPAWTRSAVVYHIFIDRFSPEDGKAWAQPDRLDGFFGGTLRGIIDRLDYIQELGANTLYLSPIFPSDSHHGYNATDYFSIEPRLGTLEDFRELLDRAHARGMRVLLDFVPNHWSDQHTSFQQAIADPSSPYRDWYIFSDYPNEYDGFFGVKCMPRINLRNPAAREHMLAAVRYWLELGVDGFRLDYAVGPTPDFWADFRKTVRSARPDAWSFGEVVDPPDAQLAFEGLLDGCLDFMLLEGFRQTFAPARSPDCGYNRPDRRKCSSPMYQ